MNKHDRVNLLKKKSTYKNPVAMVYNNGESPEKEINNVIPCQ